MYDTYLFLKKNITYLNDYTQPMFPFKTLFHKLIFYMVGGGASEDV